MKNFTNKLMIPALFLMLVGFSTCKNKDVDFDTFKIERERVLPEVESVTITGSYSYIGEVRGMAINIGEKESLTDALPYDMLLEGTDFSVKVEGLKPSTKYYYRYTVDLGGNETLLTETENFTTLDAPTEEPMVKTLEWLEMDSTTYRIKCQVVADGGSEVTERGICWNTYGDPIPYDDSTKRYEGNVGIFDEYSVRMEHLALGEKYYVRAYAKNAAGKIGYSEEPLVFETNASAGMTVEIELSCNPEDGGSVYGGGSYEVGTQCTVTAEANTGYTFVNWTENGNQVSSEASYTFTVTAGRNLIANFTSASSIIISTSVTPEGSGTTTGAGGYSYGATCTLNAMPSIGYDFEKWTKGGNTVSTNAEYTFTVTETANYVAHFKIKSYTINVSVNPDNSGTIEGGGTFNHGQSCTVLATPADGFAFDYWTDDDDLVSSEASYTFTVTSNRYLVAHFKVLQADEYFIQVSANPSDGGTVEGGGTYQQGQSCTVKAQSKPGFTFVNWKENDIQVSDLAEYTFFVERNRVLVANFESQAPNEYTISVLVVPEEGGQVSGAGTYQEGEQCNLTATANEGYAFTGWKENGNIISTQANISFIVSGDRTFEAHFAIQSYTISVSANPSNGGMVNGGGTYNYGQSCTVSATAAEGYSFVNWTEGGNEVSTDANYTFTVNNNRTLVAVFSVQAPNTYTINVSANPSSGGTVTGGGSYQQGESCTVTATANTGYTFLRWTENGQQVSTNPSYTFTVTGNRTLVAQFQLKSYNINVAANPSNGGTVTGGGSYNHGQSCTVTATPATGYTFIRWTENGQQVSTNASYTFTVTGNRTLVAQFQLKSYNINVAANPSNGGTVTGGGSYNHGQSCTVTATPATGYTFIRWTENGNQVSTNASYTFTVTGNRNLVAQFQQQTYTINVSANPSNGGTVTGGGTYQQGQSCTVTATPATGYTFLRWTENGNEVSTNASYTFTVTGNRNLVAQFQAQSYAISVSANPSNGGTVTGGGTYQQGQNCTVTATPATGHTFLRWTENGNEVSINASYTFTVNGNRTLVAQFLAQSYTINVSANPSNGGTVTGGGTYNHGQSCTVTATPATGYTFLRWTENGTPVSTNASYTFTVTGNRNLVAQFQQQTYTIYVSANPNNGGTVTGGGTYNHGQSCTVTATANNGFVFANWTENGNTVSIDASFTFQVTGNRNLVANFNVLQAPSGAIDGRFSVGNNQQVYFSKGNLQYKAGTNTWRFAEHQYDYVGTQVPDQYDNSGGNVSGSDNHNIGENYNGWIDLFGWSTSGYVHGAICYQPWSTAPNNPNYYAYGSQNYDLENVSGQADWGYNSISYGNGTTPQNQWRTLTKNEWNYVFNVRQASTINGTPNARYAKAKVADVNGVILFPDNYTHPSGVTQPTAINQPGINWNQTNNIYNSTQWGQMENQGAVFLPAAGYRGGNPATVVYYAGAQGLYWSSTHQNNDNSYMIRIKNTEIIYNDSPEQRHRGLSVRLVCSPQ